MTTNTTVLIGGSEVSIDNNPYPSTNDCARQITGGQDGVLICVKNGRRRVADGWSPVAYMLGQGSYMEVCAVGAIYAEDLTPNDLPGWCGAALYESVEDLLRDEAKEAIKLLNASAVELYPESANFGDWQGPLEWINQSAREYWTNELEAGRPGARFTHSVPKIKDVILGIYDHTISKRQHAGVH